jgi:hypothetical protein
MEESEERRLKQRLAQQNDTIAFLLDRIKAMNKETTRLKARAKGGVCPCCNRQFYNMATHMRIKHPAFKAEAA